VAGRRRILAPAEFDRPITREPRRNLRPYIACLFPSSLLNLVLRILRILRGAMTWAELREAFAARLRPIGAPEMTPPKRPR
jgi:hypothetical protein